VDRQVSCIRGRTSDRTPGAGAGAQALAERLGGTIVGEPGEPAVRDWSEDLPAARAVLESAAAAVRDAFDAGALPVLTASDCSICIATFPEVVLREPYPQLLTSLLRDDDRSRTTLIARNLQDVDPDLFRELSANDILFIDSSHVVKTHSDVNYVFFEILPRLQRGVYIHFHDIFHPFE